MQVLMRAVTLMKGQHIVVSASDDRPRPER